MPRLASSLLVASILACSWLSTRAAHAQAPAPEPGPAVAAEAHPRRVFSLTISPLHLALPLVELTGEVRVADKLGIAAIAGAGKVSAKEEPNTPKITATAYELGLSGRYYLLGDFRHGLQIGAEGLYLHVADDSGAISAAGQGLAIGPFLGYKFTADVGFTFDTQLGFQHLLLSAEATDGVQKATAEKSTNIVLLNINVGWSF